jgi:hypothetical protein
MLEQKVNAGEAPFASMGWASSSSSSSLLMQAPNPEG